LVSSNTVLIQIQGAGGIGHAGYYCERVNSDKLIGDVI